MTAEESQLAPALLEEAVARGIVTSSQRNALIALSRELAASAGAVAPTGQATASSPPQPAGPAPVESPRGFNAITVAYYLGAGLVLFAFGWFLIERWEALGPLGVLTVSFTYVALFIGSGIYLERNGFVMAGGIAYTLAVAMTPVIAWAVQTLIGWWPDASSKDAALRYAPWIKSRWIILDLATIGVGLAAVRFRPHVTLGLPIAISLAATLVHVGQALISSELRRYLEPWYLATAGTAMLACAYAIDRRQPPQEDYAFWFYLAGLMVGGFAWIAMWNELSVGRFSLFLAGVALLAAAVYLHRRLLAVFGALHVFGYLIYLAFDVFKKVLSFPVALATVGLVVIITTVWLQRRFPLLVARAQRERGEAARRLPGGLLTAWAPVVLVGVAFGLHIPRAVSRAGGETPAQTAIRWRQEAKLRHDVKVQAMRMDSARAAAARDSLRSAGPSGGVSGTTGAKRP
jgi:hypothetical protein